MRYVVLHHMGSDDGAHFDLMLDLDGVSDLLTWRLPAWPVGANGVAEEAVRLRDHRRVYLTYQGEVSGGRGRVVRVGEGKAEIERIGGTVLATLPETATRLELSQLDEEKWLVRRMPLG